LPAFVRDPCEPGIYFTFLIHDARRFVIKTFSNSHGV
jgi:hypothetical protein